MSRTWQIPLAALLAFALACAPEPAPEPVPATPDAAAAPAADWTGLVKNGRVPIEGVLTGGQPTDGELAALRDAGFETVINLRRPDEAGTEDEAGKVTRLGLGYATIPVDGAAGLTRENAAALAALLDEAPRPVLLHCGSGNRVGALLALKAFWLDGATPEEALDLGLAAGLTRLEPEVREILGAVE